MRRWIPWIGGGVVCIVLLAVGALLAGTGGQMLSITAAGLLNLPTGAGLTVAPATDQNITLTTTGTGQVVVNGTALPYVVSLDNAFDAISTANIGEVTSSKPFSLRGSTLKMDFWEQGGAFFNQIKNIGTGLAVSTVDDIDTGLTHTVQLDGNDALIYTGSTRTIALQSGTTFSVPAYKFSIPLMADNLYMSGCTLTTDVALVSGGLIEPYITCTDLDTQAFHRSLDMPDKWDGGALSVTLSVINTNASPTGIYAMKFSADCDRGGGFDTIATTISATGEQPVSIDFDDGGTCEAATGVACAQNARVTKTTAASPGVVPNGTCTGSERWLRIRGHVDAATTTATNVRVLGIKVEYAANTLTD